MQNLEGEITLNVWDFVRRNKTITKILFAARVLFKNKHKTKQMRHLKGM